MSNNKEDKLEKKRKTASIIKKLRIEKGYSQEDLVTKINDELKKTDDKVFAQSSLSNWENAVYYPSPKYIVILSKIFDVDAAYIMGAQLYAKKIYNQDNKEIANKGLKKIDINYIEKYSGQPVYYMYTQEKGTWGLISNDAQKLVLPDETSIPITSVKNTLYTSPIPFMYGIDSDCKPLNSADIKRIGKVWVEGVGGSFEARQKIKGWYRYDKRRNYLYNGNYDSLEMDGIGKAWIAFEDCVRPQNEKNN